MRALMASGRPASMSSGTGADVSVGLGRVGLGVYMVGVLWIVRLLCTYHLIS